MHRFMIFCAAAMLGAAVLISTEASARGGHHGGHFGFHHAGGHHHFGWFGGFHHAHGYRCARHWVPGLFGGHWVRRC